MPAKIQQKRMCSACGRALPLALFTRNRTKKHRREYECRECHARRERLRRCPETRREQIRLRREQLQREAWLGQHFLLLLENIRFLRLDCTGEALHIEVTDCQGHSRSCEDQDVRDLLVAALNREPTKQCHGPCGRTLPITSFGHDRNKPDGRLLRCKKCEAERVRQYKGKKQDRR